MSIRILRAQNNGMDGLSFVVHLDTDKLTPDGVPDPVYVREYVVLSSAAVDLPDEKKDGYKTRLRKTLREQAQATLDQLKAVDLPDIKEWEGQDL